MKRIIIAAMVVALAGCNLFGPPDIELSVTGSAGTANIIHSNGSGGDSYLDDHPLPWSTSFSGESGELYSISATNYDGGSLTAEVKINGSTEERNTSSGNDYVRVYAGGFAPD